jgi:hypothetical protein
MQVHPQFLHKHKVRRIRCSEAQVTLQTVPLLLKGLSLLDTHQLHDPVTNLVLPPDLLLGST